MRENFGCPLIMPKCWVNINNSFENDLLVFFAIIASKFYILFLFIALRSTGAHCHLAEWLKDTGGGQRRFDGPSCDCQSIGGATNNALGPQQHVSLSGVEHKAGGARRAQHTHRNVT